MVKLLTKTIAYFSQYLKIGRVNILRGRKMVINNHLKNSFGSGMYFDLIRGIVDFGEYINARRNFSCIVDDGGHLSIGSNCFFNHNCSITCLRSVTIGNGSTFGNNLVIVDHDHDFKSGNGYLKAPVVIGNNVWIGANVTILKGTTIGDNSIIAAGAVVSGTVPPNSILIQKRTNIIKNKV